MDDRTGGDAAGGGVPEEPRAPAHTGRAAGGDIGAMLFGNGGLLDRAVVRYGLVVGLVVTAVLAISLIEDSTGHLLLFPFYAVVVASAWLGVGPGILSLVLSALAAADFWTPPRFSLAIASDQIPSFIAFVIFALMSLAWSSERRRKQHSLASTVQQRTADLLRANTALQGEIAERKAAEHERERTERALREAEAGLARTLRLASLAELAATIAHEINQPLAAITANGGACLRSLAHDPPMLANAREAAGCIVADGHRAGDVIVRIRALFNKEPPPQQLLNVDDVIRDVLELSRGAIDRRRVEVRIELAGAAPLVMGDPVQLQQVVVNLLANALDAMSDVVDRPRVLTVRSAIERDEAVAVVVEDAGSGLDPEQLAHMFDSFYTTKPGGIGVGLAISRSIIEAHGGSLSAAPATPRGTRVGFTLPLAKAGTQ